MATTKQVRRAAALTVATATVVTLASSPATAITRSGSAKPSTPGVSALADKAAKVPTATIVSPASGTNAGGTSVTITGSGFSTLDTTNPAAVKFGDTNAKSFTVVSDIKMTAVTPAGTNGAAVVTVTNTTGTSSGKLSFIYRAPLTATFDSVIGAKPGGGTVVAVAVEGGTIGATLKEFSGEKVVAKVGDANALVSWVDESNVKITIPASTKTTEQKITLVHDGVIGPLSTSTVRYAPGVTSVLPAKVSTAGGGSVTITGVGFSSDVTDVTFGDTKATSFSVASPTQIIAVVPAGESGDSVVTVTSVGGTATGKVSYRAPLGLTVPDGTAAKASGGTVTLEVTGGTVGDSAKTFANEKITATVGSAKVAPSWVDETHVRLAMPASSAASGSITLIHDGITGAPVTVDYVPVVASISSNTDKVAGGSRITLKIAGGEPTGAKDFKFGSTAATCTSMSANAYSCVVPKADAAGPVWITFTSSAGTASRFTPQATFNYTDLE